jgi:hypothetical protein
MIISKVVAKTWQYIWGRREEILARGRLSVSSIIILGGIKRYRRRHNGRQQLHKLRFSMFLPAALKISAGGFERKSNKIVEHFLRETSTIANLTNACLAMRQRVSWIQQRFRICINGRAI